MFENDLNEFTAVQKRNHLFYRLRKDIRERLQMMINMSITRDRFATLTQCIKNSQISKADSENKPRSDRDLSSESHSKSTEQLTRKTNLEVIETQVPNLIRSRRNSAAVEMTRC